MSKMAYQNRLRRAEAKIRAHKRRLADAKWLGQGRAKYLDKRPEKAHLFGEQS